MREKTSEDSISRLIAEVVPVRYSAVKIAGEKFSCDSLDPLKIKRSALDSAGIKCRKYSSWDTAPDAYVTAYFDAKEERKENEDEEDPDDDKQRSDDCIRNFSRDMKRAKAGGWQATRDSVRQSWLDKRYGTQDGK
ncbi:hypothetical protein [Candidatus Symbiopectobacterium endolongispinus]|uniref:hypothetical protein n=1 Tax=Candidatus Symbiopectobacterium endolongispinus TaxID=2812664 RepID=UPI00207B0137|nr:hypothetical protein [Candidatus Symbiopectobacterium endolongispinus]